MTDPSPAALGALYQQLILDHYRRPHNRGELDGADVEVRLNNPTCGDEIVLRMRVRAGTVEEIRFTGQGCSISQASASMMTERLRGRPLADADALASRFREMLHGNAEAARDRALGDLRALAGVAKFPVRVRCAMLAWNALEEAAKQLPATDGSGGPEPRTQNETDQGTRE